MLLLLIIGSFDYLWQNFADEPNRRITLERDATGYYARYRRTTT